MFTLNGQPKRNDNHVAEFVLVNNPDRYAEAMRRGERYNRQGYWKQAFQSFRAALAEFPQRPEPYAGLGEACFGLRMLDRALESYKLAARYSRGDITYIERVADLQERLGQLGEAARTYTAAGELELRARRLETAIANWERAVRLDPGLLGAHRRLAMVFQRQGNLKGAVREYLAIARILQMRGEAGKALEMCRAALRLDPGNEDVLLAMDLVRHGEAAVAPAPEPSPPPVEEPTEREQMAETVRQIAHVFEEERRTWQSAQVTAVLEDPIAHAVRIAQDELSEEIFRDDDEVLDQRASGMLSKLERDALIGQGMDFQARGETAQAIACYERAIAGGLRLPAALFTLGILYLQAGEHDKARRTFGRAAQDPRYVKPMKLAWQSRS
jgi:tetratricopeptide (TPR) repeat protein